MKKNLLALILTILFVACGGNGKSIFTLDNPSDEKITVTIDGKEHSLEAKSHEKVELTAREHIVKNDKYKVIFTVYSDSKGGIINPTGYLYIKERIVYSVKETTQTGNAGDEEFIIDDYIFSGPFSVTYDFIIDRSYGQGARGKGDWDYDLFEPFPDSINMDREVNIYSKMYNKNEFLEMVQDFSPELRADYEQNKKVVKTEPTFRKEEDSYNKNMAIAQAIKDENTKKYAIEVIELDKQYAEAKDAKTQDKILKDYKKAWKEYVQASMKVSDTEKASMGYISPTNFGKGIIITSVEVK
ncbi:hypothetical protein [Fusobacterium polymorphum]|uniref:hypothetical protein n=1 Tax=Fusobacterium nucleatum subsp. polymorphum TaxID=76857 RepID=UPI00300BC16A